MFSKEAVKRCPLTSRSITALDALLILRSLQVPFRRSWPLGWNREQSSLNFNEALFRGTNFGAKFDSFVSKKMWSKIHLKWLFKAKQIKISINSMIQPHWFITPADAVNILPNKYDIKQTQKSDASLLKKKYPHTLGAFHKLRNECLSSHFPTLSFSNPWKQNSPLSLAELKSLIFPPTPAPVKFGIYVPLKLKFFILLKHIESSRWRQAIKLENEKKNARTRKQKSAPAQTL